MQYHSAKCYEDYKLLKMQIDSKIIREKISIKDKI
jgi:hypothetical protein